MIGVVVFTVKQKFGRQARDGRHWNASEGIVAGIRVVATLLLSYLQLRVVSILQPLRIVEKINRE
jgi:hypothetical protein